MAHMIIPWLLVSQFLLLLIQVSAKIPAVIVFGDSSVDAGNNNNLSTVLKSNFKPYGRDFEGGKPTGRFSNGRIPSDFISERFGCKPTIPAYLDTSYSIKDFATGVCFASAGTGYDNATAGVLNVMPLWKELEYFKDYQKKLRAYMGAEKANEIISEALYIVSMGTNDFLENYYSMSSQMRGRAMQFTIEQYQNFLAGLAWNFVKDLYNLGARKISLGGLPPMGCLPLERSRNAFVGSGCYEPHNMVAKEFNGKLEGMVVNMNKEFGGINVVLSDPYAVFLEIIQKPSLFGYENEAVACCASGVFEMGYMCNEFSPLTCTDAPKLTTAYSRMGRENQTEMVTGIPLLFQQYKALLIKNLILASRSKKATLLQLLAPAIFVTLLFLVDQSIKASTAGTPGLVEIRNPKPRVNPPIPPCEDKYYIRTPCYDFAWSGNGSSKVQSIVKKIMVNNPGRSIPPNKVISFRTPDEVDAWLLRDPMRCTGALHFMEQNATVISYGIQTNSTSVAKRGKNEDPTFKFQIPLQIAAEREIARSLIGDPNFGWVVGLMEFPHPGIKVQSAMEIIGPTFFLAIAMFSFVFQIGSLVTEKELKLRQAMALMGLYETAYWLSWLTWEIIATLIASLLTVLFGMMFQFDFFLRNSFTVLFLTFFLFQLNMIGFAFVISTFITKASSATTVGFSVFIIGFLTQIVTQSGFPYKSDIAKTYQIMWSLFPPNLFAKALTVLTDATGSDVKKKGISWRRRGECSFDDDCVITLAGLYMWFISTFFLWIFLAIYFDNIFPNSNGVRKPLLYFLNPGYWTGKGGNSVAEGGIFSWISSTPPLEEVIPDDEDVREEEDTVKRQVAEGVVDPSTAVQIQGLAKIYPGTRSIGCYSCKKTKPFHAVRGLWVNFAKDQLFCVLGPNGAGKTTTISCLTGINPVTYGDALIYGHSVRSSVGMSNIRKIIGVCPQFDILWDALSGLEHLHLFANIKGMPPSSIKSVAENSLAVVKLTPAAKIRAGSYSGGMKRRLSVAVALIGDPKLVILDEPTTGMDPITRRHVWDVIEEAKKGRAIVLTTHSMEEADILSDRIAIVAKGRLRCIGTSIRLKSRFGTGFIANVSFNGNNHQESPNINGDAGATTDTLHEALKQFFKQRLNVVPKEENKAFLTFVIPHEKEELLTSFFAELEDRKSEFGISDIQLGLASLEEVFLNIAKKAELESALAEGTLVTLTLTSGASLQILKGAKFIGIPGTETSENPKGLMVEVYWEQSEDGTLTISGHSPETPIPPNIQLPNSTSTGHGFLINANDIEGRN